MLDKHSELRSKSTNLLRHPIHAPLHRGKHWPTLVSYIWIPGGLWPENTESVHLDRTLGKNTHPDQVQFGLWVISSPSKNLTPLALLPLWPLVLPGQFANTRMQACFCLPHPESSSGSALGSSFSPAVAPEQNPAQGSCANFPLASALPMQSGSAAHWLWGFMRAKEMLHQIAPAPVLFHLVLSCAVQAFGPAWHSESFTGLIKGQLQTFIIPYTLVHLLQLFHLLWGRGGAGRRLKGRCRKNAGDLTALIQKHIWLHFASSFSFVPQCT